MGGIVAGGEDEDANSDGKRRHEEEALSPKGGYISDEDDEDEGEGGYEDDFCESDGEGEEDMGSDSELGETCPEGYGGKRRIHVLYAEGDGVDEGVKGGGGEVESGSDEDADDDGIFDNFLREGDNFFGKG